MRINNYEKGMYVAAALMFIGFVLLFFKSFFSGWFLGSGVVIVWCSQYFERLKKDRDYENRLINENIRLRAMLKRKQ